MGMNTTATPTAERGAIAGIVLAGGLSSRMGRDKALLPWQGQPLLAHMHALLKAAGADPIRVSGDYPAYAGVPDSLPRCGPLGGLYSTIATLGDGPAWVVPVDMPLLDATLLHQLRDAPPGPCVRFHDLPLPMRLNIDGQCRSLLAAMLHDPAGPRALRALQRRLGVIELPLDPALVARLRNCNTPAEWEEVVS